MEIGKLTVKRRHETGKGISRRLRAQGYVPGTCYGAGVSGAVPITVDPRVLQESLDPVKRQNTVLTLNIEGASEVGSDLLAMLWDYQIHPRRREVTHVDLVTIDPEQEIDVEVPVELTGKPAGAAYGGQLSVTRRQIPVRAKPRFVPSRLTADTSPMKIGEDLRAGDIPLPENVTAVAADDLTLATLVPPKTEVLVAAEGDEGGEA